MPDLGLSCQARHEIQGGARRSQTAPEKRRYQTYPRLVSRIAVSVHYPYQGNPESISRTDWVMFVERRAIVTIFMACDSESTNDEAFVSFRLFVGHF